MSSNPEFSRFKGAKVTEFPDGSISVRFDGRQSKGWPDADRYIDTADMDPGGELRAAWLNAMERRGRVFDVRPGETMERAERRLWAERRHMPN